MPDQTEVKFHVVEPAYALTDIQPLIESRRRLESDNRSLRTALRLLLTSLGNLPPEPGDNAEVLCSPYGRALVLQSAQAILAATRNG